jgi:hypothetical protein
MATTLGATKGRLVRCTGLRIDARPSGDLAHTGPSRSVGTQDRTLSRLDGWPMRSPVNASPRPSRATAHDSGPMWIAVLHRKGLAPSIPCRSPGASDRRADIRNWQLRANTGHCPYSITSSATSSRSREISKLRALAVLRLMTSSYLVGPSAGRSPGVVPFKILPT